MAQVIDSSDLFKKKVDPSKIRIPVKQRLEQYRQPETTMENLNNNLKSAEQRRNEMLNARKKQTPNKYQEVRDAQESEAQKLKIESDQRMSEANQRMQENLHQSSLKAAKVHFKYSLSF